MAKKWIFLVLVGVFFSFAKTQHYPRELIIKSEQFIQYLYVNDLKSAYDQTTKRVGYYDFSNSHLFKKVVERQAKSFLNAKKINTEYSSSFPSQTYGNRLRRGIAGRKLNPERKSIDFRIHVIDKTGTNYLVPFEVRWELQADESWKISFFQSHAA